MTRLAESSLRIAPDVLAVRSVGEWLRAATGVLAPETAQSLLSRAELAVHEACVNVIDHARLAPGEGIGLSLVLEDDRLTVEIEDRGRPFDLEAVRLPEKSVPQERGFGVTIIRSLTDELAYHRAGSVNRLVLTFGFGGLDD